MDRSNRHNLCEKVLGIPGQIVAISYVENMLGIVEVSGVRREIQLACIIDDQHPIESCIGDWVLVHVGFAMSRIDEAEAAIHILYCKQKSLGQLLHPQPYAPIHPTQHYTTITATGFCRGSLDGRQ
jgi:hydrogenase expression/formation protein HypC